MAGVETRSAAPFGTMYGYGSWKNSCTLPAGTWTAVIGSCTTRCCPPGMTARYPSVWGAPTPFGMCGCDGGSFQVWPLPVAGRSCVPFPADRVAECERCLPHKSLQVKCNRLLHRGPLHKNKC